MAGAQCYALERAWRRRECGVRERSGTFSARNNRLSRVSCPDDAERQGFEFPGQRFRARRFDSGVRLKTTSNQSTTCIKDSRLGTFAVFEMAKPAVEVAALDQLGVCADVLDLTVVHYDYAIGQRDHAHAMRDHERCAATREAFEH